MSALDTEEICSKSRGLIYKNRIILKQDNTIVDFWAHSYFCIYSYGLQNQLMSYRAVKVNVKTGMTYRIYYKKGTSDDARKLKRFYFANDLISN